MRGVRYAKVAPLAHGCCDASGRGSSVAAHGRKSYIFAMNSFATSCRETEAPDSGWMTRTRVHLEPTRGPCAIMVHSNSAT